MPEVRLVRQIKAPPGRVWAALTDPKLMIQWWCPDAGTTLTATADLYPGGRFSIVFRMLDGQEHNPTGVYREVLPEQKLVFTWEWPGSPERESLVTVQLQAVPGGTQLTLVHAQLPEAAAQSHAAGWAGLLDQLQHFLGDTK